MKRLITFLLAIFISIALSAQLPNTFKYVLNANGGLRVGGTAKVKIDSIINRNGFLQYYSGNSILKTEARVFNVLNYGAIGDGSTNDILAFQNAVNAAETSGGGKIIIPATSNYYKLSDTLSMKDNIMIEGDGILSRLVFESATGIMCRNISNFSIKNIRVSMSGMSGAVSAHTIWVVGSCSNGKIENCFIDNAYLGIVVSNQSLIQYYTNIEILHNIIYNIGLNGIGLNSNQEGIKVNYNTIYNFGSVSTDVNFGAAIECRGVNKTELIGNMIYDGNLDGVNSTDGIRIEYRSETGIPVQDALIFGNNIYNVSAMGIRNQFSKKSSYIANIINKCGQTGIQIRSSDTYGSASGNIISGNMIDSCNRGIYLEGSGSNYSNNNTLSNNKISNSAEYGICFYKANYNTISSNTIEKSGKNGILADYANSNMFDSNTISNSCLTDSLLSGITIGKDFICDKNIISNCLSYDTTAIPLQKYGVYIGTQATNTYLINGLYYGNRNSSYLNLGTNSKISIP